MDRFLVRINNVDVPNSNVRAIVKDSCEKDVIITQTVTRLNSGDILNIMMSVEDPGEGLGIEAIQPAGEPLVPSIILTILQKNFLSLYRKMMFLPLAKNTLQCS